MLQQCSPCEEGGGGRRQQLLVIHKDEAEDRHLLKTKSITGAVSDAADGQVSGNVHADVSDELHKQKNFRHFGLNIFVHA